MQFEEKDPQLPIVPENFPSFMGFEPLHSIVVEGVASLKRGMLRNYPLNVMVTSETPSTFLRSPSCLG